MFWYILIAVFIFTLTWLLMAPVILYTDTRRKQYMLTLPGIIRVRLVPSDQLFHIRGWIFFIPFRFNPFKARKKKNRSREKKKRKCGSFNPTALKHTLGAIRIRKLELDVDTDDYSLNAWLIPAFSYANSENIHMQVNFEGRASLLMDLRTRIGALIWNFSKHRYHSIINH